MDSDSINCPECGQKGRKLDLHTADSLLLERTRVNLRDEALRFCRTESCDVVYFGATQTFRTSDLKVTVFQKSTDPNRLVCYCFNHSVKSIQDDVKANQGTDIAEDIAKKCKAGLDDCHLNNPQGACCLANVRKVIKEAILALGIDEKPSTPTNCCGSSSTQD